MALLSHDAVLREAHLNEGLDGSQAQARAASKRVLQLAHILYTCMRWRCLTIEQVCLREQAQRLHIDTSIT